MLNAAHDGAAEIKASREETHEKPLQHSPVRSELPSRSRLGQLRREDQLRVAIGQINNWENQAPTLGQDAGIFKKHGLVLENVGTQGAGETIQAVISGSADIGAGVGVAGVMRAFSKGAPVRILAPMFTGTGDILLVREGGFENPEPEGRHCR